LHSKTAKFRRGTGKWQLSRLDGFLGTLDDHFDSEKVKSNYHCVLQAFRNYKKTWRELYIDLMKTFGKDTKREMFVYSDMGQNENER